MRSAGEAAALLGGRDDQILAEVGGAAEHRPAAAGSVAQPLHVRARLVAERRAVV